MYEWIQAGANTWYMDCPAKVGLYQLSGDKAVLIDSGSDKDAAKKVKKFLDQQKWTLTAIYNTHSHADHIGGNAYLQAQTGCAVFAPEGEQALTDTPLLEPVMLYAGCPMPELQNKFLMAKPSVAVKLTQADLPQGMELLPLPGHSLNMVGYRTADDVVFLADSLSSEATLEKYQISYLYDVKAYRQTLEQVKTLQAACFIPSHADAVGDIAPLAQLNLNKTDAIADTILGLLAQPRTTEDLLAALFDAFGLTMTLQQHVLIGSTLRSFLTYLKGEGKADCFFENNHLLWQAV